MEKLLVPGTASQTIPGKRVLVLAPHPDDEVFGCGGAIMRHLDDGGTVHVIVWTDGAWDVHPEERLAYIEQRRNESRAAAQVLGYGTPEFRAYEDRALRYSESLIHEILGAIDAHGADLVYAPSMLEMHPDHRALAMAAVEAVRRRGKDLRIALYEVGIPLRPNLLLDISDLAARKLEAMQCFTSQLARQRYDLDISALNRFRSYTLPPAVSAAEAYVVASGDELTRDPVGLYQSEHTRQRVLGLALESADFPLVSVIVRSMDRPSLALALDSIALQTYPNIEVVIVNATGTAHRPLADWCGPFPLRVIEPGGALDRSPAANRGLDAARGDLLIFLDDDDLFLPHHINRLRDELAHNPQAVAAYAGVVCTDPSGKEVRQFAEDFDPVRFAIGNFIPIHAILFRRTVLARGARFDESLPVCEDWDFWLQLHQQGPFRFVRETGAVYRMHIEAGSGIWTDQERNRRVILQIYRKRMMNWDDKVLWGIFEWTRYKPMYEELAPKYEGLNTAYEQLDRDFARTTDDYARLHAELVGQQAQWRKGEGDYKAAIAHFEAERLVANTRIADMQAAGARTQEAIADLEARIAQLVARQQELEGALRAQKTHLALIEGSISWRITQPLRSFASLLRKDASAPAPAPQSTPVAKRIPEPMPLVAEPVVQEQPAPPAREPLDTARLPGSVDTTPPQESVDPAPPLNHYDYEVDLEEKNAANFVCQLTGTDKRVLEVGCGPGSITKLLAHQGRCRVTGIELDKGAIERARPHCEAIFQADLNAADWPQVLGGAAGFDTVVAADVLEHLYDPWTVLRQMAALIAPDGNVVVSLPHAGHAVIAGCLVNGDVAYANTGLLDRTHIRFFGMKNIEDLFAQAGLKIVEVRYVIRAPEDTELADSWRKLPEFVRAALKLGKYSDVYQVVVKAVPLGKRIPAVALT